jgi:hypothetical protein
MFLTKTPTSGLLFLFLTLDFRLNNYFFCNSYFYFIFHQVRKNWSRYKKLEYINQKTIIKVKDQYIISSIYFEIAHHFIQFLQDSESHLYINMLKTINKKLFLTW